MVGPHSDHKVGMEGVDVNHTIDDVGAGNGTVLIHGDGHKVDLDACNG